MKLIIVVDSSCGLTEKEAKARGWYFLPLFLTIDGKEYSDGIDINSSNFYQICKTDSVVSTSCSSAVQIEEFLNKISSPDSFIVFYPISKYLSSQYEIISSVAKNFKNVHVISSENVSIPIVQELVELEIGVKNKEITIEEGIDIIENKIPRNLNNILLIPKYNDNLVRGGRLSPSAAKIAKLLKIVPIITFKNGKLEKLGKGRIFSKTVVKYFVEAYKNLSWSEESTVIFSHSYNEDIKIFQDKIREEIKSKKPFIDTYIPSVVAIHTGLEAMSINILKLKYDVEKYDFDKIVGIE